MKHPRTLIREAVAAQLSANLQKVDPRITASRISIHRSTPLFAILDADETLGLLVEGTRLTRTEVDQGGEGDTPVLAARLSFEVSYWTRPVVDEGELPLQVLYSWAPRIGIPHEPDYQPLLDPAGATP